MATISAPEMSPPPSLVPWVLPSSVLAVVSPSSSSRPYVSLDYLYTSSKADSLWDASYKLEDKTPVGFAKLNCQLTLK